MFSDVFVKVKEFGTFELKTTYQKCNMHDQSRHIDIQVELVSQSSPYVQLDCMIIKFTAFPLQSHLTLPPNRFTG